MQKIATRGYDIINECKKRLLDWIATNKITQNGSENLRQGLPMKDDWRSNSSKDAKANMQLQIAVPIIKISRNNNEAKIWETRIFLLKSLSKFRLKEIPTK